MDKFIRGCFIARFCSLIKRAFPGSLPGKLVAAIKRNYGTSLTQKLVTSFLSKEPKTEYSLVYSIFSKINKALFNLGALLRPISEKSLIMSLLRRFSNSGFVMKSRILSSIKKLGMRKFLLICFALYAPLDVFIRDVLQIGFLSSVWDEALMIFCVAYIIFKICSSKELTRPRITPVGIPMLFFTAIGILCLAVVSPKLGPAISGWRAVCQFMLWFFVLTRLIEDDSDFKAMYYTFMALAIVIAFHGIYQYITKAPMPANWVAQAEAGVRTRVYSIFGSPNIMGAFLLMSAPMLAASAYYTEKLWAKCLIWGGVMVLCLATLFTFSRGAWFGLTIAVVVFALLVDLKILAFAAIGIIGIIVCVPEISNRILFLFTSDFAAANSTGGRGERWELGLSLWQTSPVFGFGLGRYGGAIAMQNQEIEGLLYYYMDNYYLKTLVEMGVVGLVSYVWLLLRNLLWSIRSIFKTKSNRMSYYACGIFAGQIGVLAHSFFENIFEVPYMNAYFWGFSAAVMYLGYLGKKKKTANEK